MPAFVSPIANPATWSIVAASPLVIPGGLRYGGYAGAAVLATIGSAENVQAPTTGILRRGIDATGRVFVEVQVNPFPIRRVASALPGGLPTFYLVFGDAVGLSFTDGETVPGGEVLRITTDVTIIAVRQDRVMTDAALWAQQIEAAIVAGGGDASQWQPFANAVTTALTAGPASPVYLYDHAGQLRRTGTVEVLFGTTPPGGGHQVTLQPADGGDLQQAVARLNADPTVLLPIANLWGGGAVSFRLRPAATLDAAQLVRLQDGLTAASEISVTRQERSVAFTDLEDWFAAQNATVPVGSPTLARFTRANLLTPFVNGPEFFEDLFAALRDAQAPTGGFHLATGWALYPQTKFTKRGLGEDPYATVNLTEATQQLGADNIPLTVEQAAKLIGDAGGATRFLSAEFIQIQPGQTLSPAEALATHALISGLLIFNELGFGFARTDTVGTILLLGAWLGAAIYVSNILAADGDAIEPGSAAVELLTTTTNAQVPNAISLYAPYPARVEDNVPPPDLTDFPFDFLFQTIRNFGIYHQKFGVVRTPARLIGYCGGIDLNPNRLDDADHLTRGPYHDVHTRLEGNAVRDLAITFEQRWLRDGIGPSAFAPAAPDPALRPGGDVVQVARTYFAPAVGAGSRELEFAPGGDRTILDTILAAIDAATESIFIEDQYLTPPQEYTNHLIAKVQQRQIRQLVITVPGLADQPFGDVVRQAFVAALFAADGGAGIVRVGYPRRRFTSTDNESRAETGKLFLMADLAASGGGLPTIFLGPPARIPALPFWVSVDGELIYVYDESLVPPAEPDVMKAFTCERGTSTNFVRGGASPEGTWTREHRRGAPATVVDFTEIYVHAKLMIVDDVFLSVGSANLNRRGFSYDGEINVFTVPEALRASVRNPALSLRRRLWAEMLDLPTGILGPLVTDPLASGALFDRSPFAGNRFVPLDARTPHLMLGWTTGDAAFGAVLQGLGFALAAADQPTIYTQIVDPGSRTE
jgi:phosphatidylserine/phosphatidylglycerophosphate/cardiolipin synthase-like enzyme